MAKKKETLTPEDRLQAALVPESEQPYPVPENWCWVRLGEFSTSQYGYTAKSIENDAYPKMLRITDIQEYGVNWGDVPNCEITQDNLEKYRLSDGDIVIARTGATTGKSFLLNDPCNSVFASYLIRLRVNRGTFPKYVFNFLQTDNYWKQISELSSGIAQPGVNATKLQSLCFPLPPLSEQQRIVDRIESLFAKLDEAKQKSRDALDSFETRKAAILHKAFTGELTAQWRTENGVGMESWTSHPLKNVTQIGSGGTPSRKNSQYYLGNILWIKTGEIYWNCIYDSEEKITEEAIADSSAKLYPAGTVLVAMYGQGLTRGRAAILGVPATTNQAVCALQPCDCLEKRYLYYYFMANYWEYREKAVGGNQPNYSATMIGKWIINIPSVPEQAEIVRILDDLLAKEQQTKEAAEGVLEQIDLIKKAILARAFRGELGTNDPSEESAVELLKQVL